MAKIWQHYHFFPYLSQIQFKFYFSDTSDIYDNCIIVTLISCNLDASKEDSLSYKFCFLILEVRYVDGN